MRVCPVVRGGSSSPSGVSKMPSGASSTESSTARSVTTAGTPWTARARIAGGSLLLALALAIACKGDSPAAPKFTPAGSWFGAQASGASIDILKLSLTEDAGVVRGTGSFNDAPLTISGTFANDQATLTMASPVMATLTYRITVILPSSMMGTIRQAGSTSETVFSVDRR